MGAITTIQPITYPMRPVMGGVYEGQELPGRWSWSPKYNGWRAMVHVPSESMFNRHGDLLTIAGEFGPALAWLKKNLDAWPFEWLDCEALERRHNIGQGSLMVLDWIYPGLTYMQRHHKLLPLIPTLPFVDKPGEDQVYMADTDVLWPKGPGWMWEAMQKLNKLWGMEFFEGIVAKRCDSLYNIQLTAPEQVSSAWVKYRWSW